MFKHLRKAELPPTELEHFVKARIGQTRNQGDTVADFLDPADLLGQWTESGRAERAAGTLEPGVGSDTSVGYHA
jgi:hypothetical protein